MTLDAYDELCAWTLGLGDAEFVHQHVVDAHMLQTADERTRPIGIAFALAGLYLYLERDFSGREVQRAHMRLGKIGGPWPRFQLPGRRGELTHLDVLREPAGPARLDAIRAWCASAWDPWSGQRDAVVDFLQAGRVLPRPM